MAFVASVALIAGAAAYPECPTSHPFECRSESDVSPPTQAKYFHGPCCDKNSDCVCDAYCGEGCDDGAHALPHEPVVEQAEACLAVCLADP